MNPICRICNNAERKNEFKAYEKHFGTNQEFDFFECPECETIQISTIPEDIDKYYPPNYYSKLSVKHNPVKIFIKEKWLKNYFEKGNLIGSLLSKIKGEPPFFSWLKIINAKLNDSILDVGSGVGLFLADLELAGFKDLTGIDPFIDESRKISDHFRLIKGYLKDIVDLGKKYSFIIFNFSYEHIPNPLEVMQDARLLQDKDNTLVIRIPVTGSYVWEKYGIDWIALDAPRHFHILSVKAMNILASKSSYKVVDVIYDSSVIQFWGSELYKHNIPLTKTKFGSKNPMADFRDIISSEQMKEFENLTQKMNQEKRGDQAIFILKAI